jgi:hypothetical protein
VERQEFDDLDAAVAELERRAEEVRGEGPLERVDMLRTFEPSQQVAARLEISIGGLFRHRDVGVDVRGDRSVVAFTGGVRRQELEPRRGRSVYEELREALQGMTR